MRDPDQEPTPPSTNPESTSTPAGAEDARPEAEAGDGKSRLARFGREHPALTVLGLGTVGLLGGIELATGVLLGAGVATVIRRRPKEAGAERAERARGRIRRLLARRPHDLRELKERARAVALAATGELTPSSDGQPPRQAHPA